VTPRLYRTKEWRSLRQHMLSYRIDQREVMRRIMFHPVFRIAAKIEGGMDVDETTLSGHSYVYTWPRKSCQMPPVSSETLLSVQHIAPSLS